MSEIEQGRESGIYGNTNNKSHVKSQDIQTKHYCFTLNRYIEQDIITIKNLDCNKYVFQEEIGEEGTRHLQGYIEFTKKKRFSELKKINNRIHWEKCKNIEASIKYCQKLETRNGNVYFKNIEDINISDEDKYGLIKELKIWQQDIVTLIKTEPDGRTINWFYDNKGGKGKSALCKYLYIKHDCLVIQGGKLQDIMNIIFNANMNKYKTVIIDIPRCNGSKVSYSAIECILNGMITNTKYETGTKIFKPPHVIVFSNDMPNKLKLSEDRWKITDLDEYDIIQ